MKIKVCIFVDFYEEIEVNENSVVEVIWNGCCRGEFFKGREYEWKGIEEIMEGVEELERDLSMGEEGVDWIKVDGKVVYSCCNGDLEEIREGLLDEVDGLGEEIKEKIRNMSEEEYYDMEWFGELCEEMDCFS